MTPQWIKFFLIDAVPAVEKLEAFVNKDGNYSDEDIKEFTVTVHSMKSALANMGEHELSSDAAKLERAGKENKTEEFNGIPDFVKKLRTVITNLTPPEEDNEDSIVITESDCAELREKLDIIKQANDILDNRTAKATINELRAMKWPSKITQLIDKMSEHLLGGDLKEVSHIADLIDYICDDSL